MWSTAYAACSLLDEPVDHGGLWRCFLALVEHVVEPAGADPDHLAIAPQLLAEHAHALVHPFADGLGLERGLALRGEGRPVRLLAGALDLAIRDQVLRHGCASISSVNLAKR